MLIISKKFELIKVAACIRMNTVIVNNVETATPALSANSTTVATTINAKSTEANSVEVVAKRKPSVTLTEQETDEDSTSAPGRDCNKIEKCGRHVGLKK